MHPIVANLIVKNEANVIERCLDSIRGIITHVAIADTGSTDGTVGIIKAWMLEHRIPGRVEKIPWVDFASCRNSALAIAREVAPPDAFSLMVDADEVLEFAPDFKLPDLVADGYWVTSRLGDCLYGRIQLVRLSKGWRWQGKVHEYVRSDENPIFADLPGVLNLPHPDGARARNPNRFLEDAAILEREIELHNEPRDIFYCANSYRDGQDHGKALRMYERRVARETDANEERWFAQFQVACLKAILGAPTADIEAELRRAIAMRPHRNEPYVALAKLLNDQKRYAEALPWAAAAIWQRPTTDRLFIDAPSWTWKPRSEAGVAMAMLGRPTEAKGLWLQALNAKPNPIAAAGLMANLQQIDRVLAGVAQLPLGEKTPGVEMELARYLREQAELPKAA